MDVLMLIRTILIVVLLVSGLGFSRADTGSIDSDEVILALIEHADSLHTFTLDDSMAIESQLSYPGTPNNGPVDITELYGSGSLLGWVVERWAMGRYDPFRFAVAMDTSFAITGMKVLEYRSSYGGEIQDPGFLRQFTGLSDPEQIALGKGVDGVSGASYSARSIIDETRYTLMALQWLQSIGTLSER
jgi:FMN-binding domain